MYTSQYIEGAMSSILTIRVSDDIKNSLDQLAEAWQVSEIKKGLSEIEAGEFISHEEVVKQWKQRHADSLII